MKLVGSAEDTHDATMVGSRRNTKRVAIVVPNSCDPDYRVIKQAETLAAAGYQVAVFATTNSDAPGYEEFNGVAYYRRPWRFLDSLRAIISGSYRAASDISLKRE